MGKNKKKPFIDKSKSTTYNLLYRASEVEVDGEDAGSERVLVDAARGLGIGRVDEEAATAAAASSTSRYPPGHPLEVGACRKQFQCQHFCSTATGNQAGIQVLSPPRRVQHAHTNMFSWILVDSNPPRDLALWLLMHLFQVVFSVRQEGAVRACSCTASFVQEPPRVNMTEGSDGG